MRSLLPYILLALLASCGGKQGEVVIRGHLTGLRQTEFYIYSTDCGRAAIDTIPVRSGRFEYTTRLDGSATFHLLYPHLAEQVIFANSGDVIDIEGDASNLREVEVDGNADNKAYTRLRLQLNGLAGEAARDSAIRTFIDGHRDSRVSDYLQQQLAARGPLRPLIREGGRLPSFVLANDTASTTGPRLVNADTLSRDSLKGQPALIVFMHNWTTDRMATMHRVRQAMCAHDSLRTLLYSLDADYYSFMRMLRRDSVLSDKYRTRWFAYCDRRALRSDLVVKWRVGEFPFFILTDDKGVIKRCSNNFDDLKL